MSAAQDLSPDSLPSAESFIERRNMLLTGLDKAIIDKAWFTLSHLLLPDGAVVLDMGCDDGAMTFAMAAMNPKLRFTGIDKNKRSINKARERFELHNLDFRVADASSEVFGAETVDAIINSYALHEIYSSARYNERIVGDTLRTHMKMLKKGGTLFIRDFARPPPEKFVMMEMPDIPSESNDLQKLSEADLLVWYSEHARPRQDPGCGGFFLEELPGRFPGTRLFRLPYKWAYEFIMRKDDRAQWEKELPIEYTFFTPRQFRRELIALGGRVQYSGPYWDEDYIEEKFEGRFKLYANDGTPLGYPATCFIAVTQKMAERKSLYIEERRAATPGESRLKITAMRNEKTGRILDIASRDVKMSEVLPYRVDEDGRLKIYLHEGVGRSIANAVPRNGVNIDGRQWSGHMVEAISVEEESLTGLGEIDVKQTVRFARDYLGLKPNDNAILEHGPDYYPAPDYIDDKICTFYLRVDEAKGQITPKAMTGTGRLQARGHIREMDAQQVLNAITVGMIPNARLELQILSLFQHLNVRAETWTQKQITFQAGKIAQKTYLKDLMAMFSMEDKRFKDVKGTVGQIRPVHSIFVEEGQTRGAVAGLSSQDTDFIVRDDQTVNTAVVLPLTKGVKQDVHAGFLLDHMPVPQRHDGSATIINVPSFNIPPEVTNLKMLKKFVADQYGVLPNVVIKLGESYYTHVGMTPHRIYPFAVSVPNSKSKAPDTQFLPFYQFMLLRRSLSVSPHFLMVISRAYRYLHQEIRLDFDRRVQAIVKQRFGQVQQDWSLPLNYELGPNIEKRNTKKGKDAAPGAPDSDIPEPRIAHKNRLEQKIQEKTDKKPEKPVAENVPENVDAEPDIAAVLDAHLHGETETQVATATAAAQPADGIDTPPKKVNMIAKLADEFETELVDFIDALEKEKEHQNKPVPERW